MGGCKIRVGILMLTQLLYISEHNGVIPEMAQFMESVRDRNKSRGLSSILLSTDKFYLHLIEGMRPEVNKLYNRIITDPKHFNCTILRYIEIKKREFAEWNAEYVGIEEFDVGDINLLLPSGVDINAEDISSARGLTIIRRIHAHLLIRSSNLI